MSGIKDSRLIPPWMTAKEIESIARLETADSSVDYFGQGSGEELTLRANVNAFDRYRLIPHVARSVSSLELSTDVLSTRLDVPLFVSPMGNQSLMHPDGELAMAAAAADAGFGFTLSTGSSWTIEEVAEVAGPARWFQLYFLTTDRDVLSDLIRRATESGYCALCVTVDNPVHGFRRASLRRGGSTRVTSNSDLPNLAPYKERIESAGGSASDSRISMVPPLHFPVTWNDLRWLRGATSLPIVVKGILHPEDARAVIDMGMQGVVVSNHGGRQLDHCIATLEALPAVASAVGESGIVLMDGGVRRATDAVIAIALGAHAVGLGRAAGWALAYGGRAGATSYLRNFRTEFTRVLQLVGATTPRDLTTDLIYDSAWPTVEHLPSASTTSGHLV